MSFSEKWQSFLDKINNRIPIKKITKPIDKINPLASFILLIIIVLVLVYFLIPHDSFTTTHVKINDITVKLADDNGNILKNFDFTIKNIVSGSEKIYSTDNTGQALLHLNSDGSYEIIISKKGYLLFDESIDVTQSEFKGILKVLKYPTTTTKTLSFVDSLTNQVIENPLDVKVTCENGQIITPDSTNVTDGEYSFEIPVDCGALLATASNDKYYSSSVTIPATESVVKVTPKTFNEEVGSIRIKVTSGNTFPELTINLFKKEDPINIYRTQETMFSSVFFRDIPVGDYRAVAFDPLNQYQSADINFTINKNQLLVKTIDVVSNNVNTDDDTPIFEPKTINVKIFGLDTQEEITDNTLNPTVTLLEDGNKTVGVKYLSDGFTFVIDKNKSYTLRASAESYLTDIKPVLPDVENYTFNLEKITISNVSKIKARFYDEDDLPIVNSKVLIYDAKTKYIDVRFAPETTDDNGFVTFTNIPSGNYYLKIKNNYLDDVSESFDHTTPDDTNINVQVTIGTGTAELIIKNKYGDIIPQPTIDIYDVGGTLIGSDFASAVGIFSKELKANKRVYFKVSADGYASYYTDIISLYKDKTTIKDIVVSEQASQTTVDYLGAFNDSDQKIETLQNNKIYTFKFRVNNPVSSNKFGFVFKIGTKQSAQTDIAYIKKIDNTFGSVVYYSQEPFTNVVSSDSESKLVNIMFTSVTPGVYEIEIPVRIRNAAINDEVPIYFTSYLSTKPDFMDNSEFMKAQYFIDSTKICNGAFCFKGQYVDVINNIRYNIDDDLTIPMLINSDYSLEYFLSNQTSTVYPKSRLKIANTDTSELPIEMVSIKNYTLTSMFDDQGFSDGVDYFKVPFSGDEITTDNIPAYSKGDFNLTINPLYIGQSKLSTDIYSDQQNIYNLKLNLVSKELHNMSLDYVPKNIVPGVSFDMQVTVLDEQGDPVTAATVNILQKINDSTNLYATRKTDDYGVVNISVPALNLGETIIIQAQKPTYFAESKTIKVSEDVVDVLNSEDKLLTDEAPLEINIHKNDVSGNIVDATLKNKTKFDLKLNDFLESDISFNYPEFLDLGKTQNFLNSQVSSDFIIPANSEKTLQVKMVPGNSASLLVSTREIVGSIKGHVSTVTSQPVSFVFNIPVNVKLSVGQGVNIDNCLVLDTAVDWSTVVNGGQQRKMNFYLRNNCTSKENPEQPISLKNVKARIKFNGDKIGHFDVALGNTSTRLSEGILKTVYGTLDNSDTSLLGTITYNPDGVKFGDVEAQIIFNGQVETDSGLKNVNTDDSTSIKVNIKIANLIDCFEVYDASGKINGMLEIGQDITKQIGTKDLIIKNKCSDVGNFKLTFCPNKVNDLGCRDLKFDGLTDRLAQSLRFNKGESEQTIKIYKPKVPGAYVLNILIQNLNNRDAPVASVIKELKINVKDKLWMYDPFLEVDPNTKSTASKDLYNSDINKTPWAYAQKVHDDSGFSAYMDSKEIPNAYFNKMLFNDPTHLENSEVEGNGLGWILGGSGTTALTVAIVLAKAGILGGATTSTLTGAAAIGASLFPAGPIILLGLAVTMFVLSGMHNDYLFVPEYSILDVPKVRNLPKSEVIKTITLDNLNESKAHINIFDITGSRYFTYLKLHAATHNSDKYKSKNKLYKDATLTATVPICNGEENLLFYKDYKVVNEHKNCDGDFSKYDVGDDQIEYGVKCYGSSPTRNKIDLSYDAYVACKYNENYWPEQSGIKPLLFKISPQVMTDLNNSSSLQVFKSIDFYPNIDDDETNIDEAFKSSEDIGKFRFAYYLAQPKQEPNRNQEIIDCSTDSGKVGFTGPGAVPNVSLDWTWDPEDLDKCSKTYCDATQLTQVILNRIDKIKKLLETNQNLIDCPKSNEQVIDEATNNKYMFSSTNKELTNDIPTGKVGVDLVVFSTDDKNIFTVKTNIINRTASDQIVNLKMSFGNYTPTSVYKYNPEIDDIEKIDVSDSYDFTIPSSEDIPFIFNYGETNKIIANNIPLVIEYSGDAIDPEYSNYNSDINLFVKEPTVSNSCQVPATTGLDYIDIWFNKEIYPKRVKGDGWSKEDIQKLKDYLSFDAYLITDKYNQNFIDAFDKAYGGKVSQDEGGVGSNSLIASPTVFNDGYLSPLFKNHFNYILKYSTSSQNAVDILTPGKYNVRIDLVFNNDKWYFTTTNGKVDANAFVTFSNISGPRYDSMFYRLPFDGLLGYNNGSYNRQGYGLSYIGDSIKIGTSTNNADVLTASDDSSNSFKFLNIKKENDIFKLNSGDTRGNILKLTNNQDNQVQMIYSPSIANPIKMKISKTDLNPFSVYYRLENLINKSYVYSGSSLLNWSGIGEGCDYYGDYISSAFYNTPDQASQAGDSVQKSYKLSWDYAINNKGNIYLRSILYTPSDKNYKYYLKNETYPTKVKLNDQDDLEIPLSSAEELTSFQELFSKIKNKEVCVTNSDDGSSTEFWWNPSQVYKDYGQKTMGDVNYFIATPDDALSCYQ